MLSTARHGATN